MRSRATRGLRSTSPPRAAPCATACPRARQGPRGLPPHTPGPERAARASARRRTGPSRRSPCRSRRASAGCRRAKRGNAPAGATTAPAAPLPLRAGRSSSSSGRPTTPARARARLPAPRSLAVSSAEGQIRLGRERRDPDARKVEPLLVHDEAALPLREELPVEEQEIVELEVALERAAARGAASRWTPESSASGASSAANGAKFSETRSNPSVARPRRSRRRPATR